MILVERGGNRRDRVMVNRVQGLIAEQRRDWLEAERRFREALVQSQELKSKDVEAIGLNALGRIARAQEHYDCAAIYYQQALVVAKQIEFTQEAAETYVNLGLLSLDRDCPQEARHWFEHGLTLAQEIGRQYMVAEAQAGLAQTLEVEGRYDEALGVAWQALRIHERLRHQNLAASRELVARLQQRMEG